MIVVKRFTESMRVGRFGTITARNDWRWWGFGANLHVLWDSWSDGVPFCELSMELNIGPLFLGWEYIICPRSGAQGQEGRR